MPIFIIRLVDDSGWSMTGGARPGRQRAGRDGKALRHQLPRQQEVGAALELEDDRRQLGHRLGTHDVEPRQPVERLLQRNGDQLLHFGCGQPESTGSESRPAAARIPERRPPACREIGRPRRPPCPRQWRPPGTGTSGSIRRSNETRLDAPLAGQCPTSNSVPYSSATPTVTTSVPTSGPSDRTARSFSM